MRNKPLKAPSSAFITPNDEERLAIKEVRHHNSRA
jgi:hypothetical protein